MSQYTIEEYANLLTRTYAPRFPRDNRPRTVTDVTEKGEEVLEFILPHPTNGRFSVSLQAYTYRGAVSDCALHFGQTEVASRMDPEEAIAAMNEIIDDHIVAIVRYKNREDYENHRKINARPMEWLFQVPDDEEDLAALLDMLKKPAGFWDRFSGKYVGVFEVYRWNCSEVIER